jgi:cold shock CspA family protein
MSINKGRVKFFDSRRQYGFITPDDAKPGDRSANVFFGRKSLPYSVSSIEPDARVEYEVTMDQLGRTAAKNVRPLDE